MDIRSETFSLTGPAAEEPGAVLSRDILPGEVQGVRTELLHISGPARVDVPAEAASYTVLLALAGAGTVLAAGESFRIATEWIVRLPPAKGYRLDVPADGELHCLRISKTMDAGDMAEIAANPEMHSTLYATSFTDCPAYSEEIKSDKTVSRMLLDKGMVPRFCMGTVETAGPDSVDSHCHAMLDQLFLGLRGCRCTVRANGAQATLGENCLLHVPLGASHSVSVAEGDILRYVWLDFFLSLEGQSYMASQHTIRPDEAS